MNTSDSREAKANAAYLAHCANVLPELVEALRSAVTKWEISQDIKYRRLGLPTPKDEVPDWIVKARTILDRAETITIP